MTATVVASSSPAPTARPHWLRRPAPISLSTRTVALLLAKSDVYDEMEADLVADGELLLHYDKSDVIETDRTRYLLGAAEVSEIDQNGNECSINLFTLERTTDYVNENLTVVSIGGELVPALRLI